MNDIVYVIAHSQSKHRKQLQIIGRIIDKLDNIYDLIFRSKISSFCITMSILYSHISYIILWLSNLRLDLSGSHLLYLVLDSPLLSKSCATTLRKIDASALQ